jgi:hypothetical protein
MHRSRKCPSQPNGITVRDSSQPEFCNTIDGQAEILRELTLIERKAKLDRLIARRPAGIFVGSFEQGEIGPDATNLRPTA